MRRSKGRFEGSSPLARGLRGRGPDPRARQRIIPARAGFTPRPGHHVPAQRDHPRSRGVYSPHDLHVECPEGSSPLARGLRSVVDEHRAQNRIIPARAGFTMCGSAATAPSPDHPRSRGVYRVHVPDTVASDGSSPLARGLRPPACASEPRPGIIPARAGFTSTSRWVRGACRDHPRSRGVYSSTSADARNRAGSSPLARGLQGPNWIRAVTRGIIPARAGFTRGASRLCRRGRDHPRSRGVYPTGRPSSGTTTGSSPLARGLPAAMLTVVFIRRIIPARAGFTPAAPRSAPAPADHPRSRGVYYAAAYAAIAHRGSSPLARGLPMTTQ